MADPDYGSRHREDVANRKIYSDKGASPADANRDEEWRKAFGGGHPISSVPTARYSDATSGGLPRISWQTNGPSYHPDAGVVIPNQQRIDPYTHQPETISPDGAGGYTVNTSPSEAASIASRYGAGGSDGFYNNPSSPGGGINGGALVTDNSGNTYNHNTGQVSAPGLRVTNPALASSALGANAFMPPGVALAMQAGMNGGERVPRINATTNVGGSRVTDPALASSAMGGNAFMPPATAFAIQRAQSASPLVAAAASQPTAQINPPQFPATSAKPKLNARINPYTQPGLLGNQMPWDQTPAHRIGDWLRRNVSGDDFLGMIN